MPLHIVQNDITTMEVDAIVNPTNELLIGYSGVDKKIHDIGGQELDRECKKIRDMVFLGQPGYTKAYNLPSKFVIHSVSPIWEDGCGGELPLLTGCYRSSLEVADELGCKTVAIPVIGAGNNGYPIQVALKTAVVPIKEYLALYSDMDVYLVIYGDANREIAESIFGDLESYVEDNYKPNETNTTVEDLDAIIKNKGEDFVEMIYKHMDKKGIEKPSSLYKKAGITKATWSKLISGGTKSPSVETAVSLAFALELSYDETVKLLGSAGLALTNSRKFDIIVSYFIKNGNYDIWELDIQLVKYGCKSILGSE